MSGNRVGLHQHLLGLNSLNGMAHNPATKGLSTSLLRHVCQHPSQGHRINAMGYQLRCLVNYILWPNHVPLI
jgi:hypothetical protein